VVAVVEQSGQDWAARGEDLEGGMENIGSGQGIVFLTGARLYFDLGQREDCFVGHHLLEAPTFTEKKLLEAPASSGFPDEVRSVRGAVFSIQGGV